MSSVIVFLRSLLICSFTLSLLMWMIDLLIDNEWLKKTLTVSVIGVVAFVGFSLTAFLVRVKQSRKLVKPLHILQAQTETNDVGTAGLPEIVDIPEDNPPSYMECMSRTRSRNSFHESRSRNDSDTGSLRSTTSSLPSYTTAMRSYKSEEAVVNLSITEHFVLDIEELTKANQLDASIDGTQTRRSSY